MSLQIVEGPYCCPVRRHLFIGIIGERKEAPPVELADFIIQWEPQLVVGIKYCPFCGQIIKRGDALRIAQKLTDPPDEDDS